MTKKYSIAIEAYERLVEGRRNFWEAYEEFRRQFDLAELAIDPEEVFGGRASRSTAPPGDRRS